LSAAVRLMLQACSNEGVDLTNGVNN